MKVTDFSDCNDDSLKLEAGPSSRFALNWDNIKLPTSGLPTSLKFSNFIHYLVDDISLHGQSKNCFWFVQFVVITSRWPISHIKNMPGSWLPYYKYQNQLNIGSSGRKYLTDMFCIVQKKGRQRILGKWSTSWCICNCFCLCNQSLEQMCCGHNVHLVYADCLWRYKLQRPLVAHLRFILIWCISKQVGGKILNSEFKLVFPNAATIRGCSDA